VTDGIVIDTDRSQAGQTPPNAAATRKLARHRRGTARHTRWSA